jgi:hypothetical protein
MKYGSGRLSLDHVLSGNIGRFAPAQKY